MFYSLSPLDQISQKAFTYCPVCGAKKDYLEIVKVREKDEGYLVFIKCKKCASGILGLVNIGPMGVSIVNTVTDLEEEETSFFLQQEKVNSDDVLDLHEILEDKGHNFLELIKLNNKKK